MAEENWLRVALTSMALGVGLYLIPLAMIARPDLIRLAEAPGSAIFSAALVGSGRVIISYALIGLRGPLRTAIGMGLIFVTGTW